MANYNLDEVEQERADKFQKWHKRHKKKDESSAPFSYRFTSTGIGVAVSIICPYCGKEKDITNIDCW